MRYILPQDEKNVEPWTRFWCGVFWFLFGVNVLLVAGLVFRKWLN